MSKATNGSSSFGCLFCVTGKERWVRDTVEARCPQVRAIVAQQEKHKSLHGQKSKVKTVLLPSYVFFQAAEDFDPHAFLPMDHVIRLLTQGEGGTWRLSGEDARFVQWLFRHDGLLSFSKAYKDGDQIRILSGPLKDQEGRIARVDKRGRSIQVILSFQSKEVPVWLGYDLVDYLEERKAEAIS